MKKKVQYKEEINIKSVFEPNKTFNIYFMLMNLYLAILIVHLLKIMQRK